MIWNSFTCLGLLTAIGLCFSSAQVFAGDFDTSQETVGRSSDGLITPVNQRVTPAGTLVELPGMRPQAIALSPDGTLLVTAGLTHDLVAVDPGSGKIIQRVALPSGKMLEPQPVASVILDADNQAQLSFTGLKFSPDGTRLYLANVNGDVKVFEVGHDHKISPLFSISLPPANAPGRKEEIPAGLAVHGTAKNSTFAAIFRTNCLSWTRQPEKFCRLGTWALRRSMWCQAKIKFMSATGAGGGLEPTASPVRLAKACVFAWMRAASRVKVQ